MPNLSFVSFLFLFPGAIGAIIRVIEGGRTPPKFRKIGLLAIAYGSLLLFISNWPLLIDVSTGTPVSTSDRFIAFVGSVGILGISFVMMVGAYSFTGRIADWLIRNDR